jgi:hypothetical protein
MSAAIRNWFTERFEAKDLQDASALLDEQLRRGSQATPLLDGRTSSFARRALTHRWEFNWTFEMIWLCAWRMWQHVQKHAERRSCFSRWPQGNGEPHRAISDITPEMNLTSGGEIAIGTLGSDVLKDCDAVSK